MATFEVMASHDSILQCSQFLCTYFWSQLTRKKQLILPNSASDNILESRHIFFHIILADFLSIFLDSLNCDFCRYLFNTLAFCMLKVIYLVCFVSLCKKYFNSTEVEGLFLSRVVTEPLPLSSRGGAEKLKLRLPVFYTKSFTSQLIKLAS